MSKNRRAYPVLFKWENIKMTKLEELRATATQLHEEAQEHEKMAVQCDKAGDKFLYNVHTKCAQELYSQALDCTLQYITVQEMLDKLDTERQIKDDLYLSGYRKYGTSAREDFRSDWYDLEEEMYMCSM